MTDPDDYPFERPALPQRVTVYEVGPRDGLQNEPEALSIENRAKFVDLLTEAGLPAIEVGSFVSPAAVPQLAATEQVFAKIHRASGVRYPALVPNLRGLERAMAAGRARDRRLHRGVGDLQTGTTSTRESTSRSSGSSRWSRGAAEEGIRVRGYVSTAFGCPYEGEISPDAVREVVHKLLDLPVDEISIGDTIGVATPSDVFDVVETLYDSGVTRGVLALHMHDTRGTALANVYAGLQCGITTFDSSAGGLGGCPYAPGASGNLATEDLLFLLEGLGVETGVTLPGVVAASRFLAGLLGRRPPGRYLSAVWGQESPVPVPQES